MRDLEQELRRLFEHKSDEVVATEELPTNSLVWRARIARAALPSAALIVIAAGIVGASVLPSAFDRGVSPAPADRDGKETEPRDSYPIPDSPMYLMPSDRGLWAVGFRINHIDFHSNQSTSTEGLGGVAKGATYGFGRAWAAMEDEEGSSRLVGAQVEDNFVSVTDEVEIEGLRNIGNYYLATGHGAVWVTSADGHVHRYDPETQELETFDIAEHFKDYSRSNGALLVASGDAFMWFAATPGSVVAFDPQTMEPAGPRRELGWNTVELDFANNRLVVLHTTPRGAHRVLQIEESADATMTLPIQVGKYGPDGTLVAKGNKAYIFRWKRGKQSFVYRVTLSNGRVIKQEHVARDPYESFTVSNGYGWIGHLSKREVRRIPLPHRLVD